MAHDFRGLFLQEEPAIFVVNLLGSWLLQRTTPSWRIEDPVTGFQRRVSEERARSIAVAVLDQGRTFPNAIVLATDNHRVSISRGVVSFPQRIKFLVVDGQHRLWAQHFSARDSLYCCMVHVGLSEEDMARLFVEINDTQKRVPSSLRWDLVRLVRDEKDPHGVRAVDLVYDLTTEMQSPLFQRVDLTGEQHVITLKQGSLAPSIKSLVSKKTSPLADESYENQLSTLQRYFSAIRELDADGWDRSDGPLYKARVLRALLRLLPDILIHMRESDLEPTAHGFLEYIELIDLNSLDPEIIRGQQGGAGIKAIYNTIHDQVFAA